MTTYKSLYFQGNYDLVINGLHKKGISHFSEEEMAYVVGSFFMLGQVETGNALCKQTFRCPSAQITVNFFNAMSLMRRSKYHLAKNLFVKNYDLIETSGEHQFFIDQGMAFFDYYTGNFTSALDYANNALKICQTYNLYFESIYALEILGHIHIQLGMFHHGLSIFEQAKKSSIDRKCFNIARAIEANILGYKLEGGMDLKRSIAQAKELLKSYALKEYYLKGQLYLQLAKAFFLSGDIDKMEQALSDSAFSIYKTGNKRQGVLLNISLSYLDYIRKKFESALFHLGNARQSIVKNIDNILEIKINGLEGQILETWDRGHAPSFPSEERECTYFLHQVIQARKKNRAPPASCTDPVHLFCHGQDFKCPPTKEFILRANERGLLGVINLFKLQISRPQCYFNLIPGRILTLKEGNIRWSHPKLTNFQYQVIKFIFLNKNLTKKELIENFWGYSYDPFIHDHLIYNTIARIRKLNPHLTDMIKIENTISLAMSIDCIGIETKIKKSSLLLNNKSKNGIKPSDSELNYRQLELLHTLKKGDTITPYDYRGHFSISRITATRDLNALKKMNYLVAIGQTRSLRYIRTH